jgi:hypothetical protein
MCTFPLVRRCDPLGIDTFNGIDRLPIDSYEVYQFGKQYNCLWLCILSGKHMMYWCSCLMDFKGHIINVFGHYPFKGLLICTRSTAVKFGIPLRPVLKHGPRSLSSMQVNGYIKPICVNNLTIQWDYE